MSDQFGQTPPNSEWQQPVEGQDPGYPQYQQPYQPPYQPPGQQFGQAPPYGYAQPPYPPAAMPPPGGKPRTKLYLILGGIAGVILILILVGVVGAVKNAGSSAGSRADVNDPGCVDLTTLLDGSTPPSSDAQLSDKVQYYVMVGIYALGGSSLAQDPALATDLKNVGDDASTLKSDDDTTGANDAADVTVEQGDLAKVNQLCGTSF